MKNISRNIKLSTRKAAKEAGIMDNLLLCRKHVAVFFGSAVQAAPAILSIIGRSFAWDGRTAPADAAGFLRSALSAAAAASGSKEPMRILTEHRKSP